MPKQKISAKDLVSDIRAGINDSALMKKYGVSAQGLQSLFIKLVEAKILNQQELDNRTHFREKAINVVWKCPACGKPQTRQFDECPECGVILSKLTQIVERKRQEERDREEAPKRQKQEALEKENQEETKHPQQYCPGCGVPLPAEVKFCQACRKKVYLSEITIQPLENKVSRQSISEKQLFRSWIAGFMLFGGLILAFYYFLFFDISVQAPTVEVFGQTVGGQRVANLSLMSQRQNGTIFGLGLAILVLCNHNCFTRAPGFDTTKLWKEESTPCP
jgi:hypothetical protein